MFISFPQFVSRNEMYFPKFSCLIAADGGTLHEQHTMVAMHHIHGVTKPLICCIMTSCGPWLLRCFKRGFGYHRKQPIDEFNWIVISIEIQLIKTANRMAKLITLFVNSFKQQYSFRSNLTRLNDGGISPSVVVAGFQFCLTNMADRKPNPCIVKWILFTWYLNSPPFRRPKLSFILSFKLYHLGLGTFLRI